MGYVVRNEHTVIYFQVHEMVLASATGFLLPPEFVTVVQMPVYSHLRTYCMPLGEFVLEAFGHGWNYTAFSIYDNTLGKYAAGYLFF